MMLDFFFNIGKHKVYFLRPQLQSCSLLETDGFRGQNIISCKTPLQLPLLTARFPSQEG